MIDIYLACPYSHPDPAVRQQRFEEVNKFAAKLMGAGLTVYSSISHTHPIALAGDLPKGWDYWQRLDREFMRACSTLVILDLPGTKESVGVRGEIDLAIEFGIQWFRVFPEDADMVVAFFAEEKSRLA